MKRPRLRLRRRKEGAEETAATEVAGPTQASGPPGKPEGEAAPEGEAPKPGEPVPPRLADPHERIDGLRAWLADIERKLGIRTYAIGAATVLALAAAIVAIILVLNVRDDAATTEEMQALRDQIGLVREQTETAVGEQIDDLVERVETLERRTSRLADDQTGIDRELQALQDDIDDLREQVLDLEDDLAQAGQNGGGGGGGGGGAGLGGGGAGADDLP